MDATVRAVLEKLGKKKDLVKAISGAAAGSKHGFVPLNRGRTAGHPAGQTLVRHLDLTEQCARL